MRTIDIEEKSRLIKQTKERTPMGRPTVFVAKTDYNRKKDKQRLKKELSNYSRRKIL